MSTKPKLKASAESEVWNAIAAFERILEAMPNDRVALETLFDAYQQIGQSSRAVEYLIRLGQTIVEENDSDTATKLLERFARIQDDDPAVEDMAKKLRELAGSAILANEGVHEGDADGKRRTVDISCELSLAWTLLQAGELSQEQYSTVVHDLSECSTKEQETPVTVLHMLQGRGFANLDKTVGFLAKDASTPVVTLSNFEIQKQAYATLPMDFMTTGGAIVFELMGSDALVAVLNPYDKPLRDQVEQLTDRTCHYYLVTPSDYDRTLEDIRSELGKPAA